MMNQVSIGDAVDVAASTDGVVAGNGYLVGAMFGTSPVTAGCPDQPMDLGRLYPEQEQRRGVDRRPTHLLEQHGQAGHHNRDVEYQDRCGCSRCGHPSPSGVVCLNGIFGA
jgi:hypothetical protein